MVDTFLGVRHSSVQRSACYRTAPERNPPWPSLPPQPSITLRFLAAPTDVIIAGSAGVHGGRVLEWIDKAA